MDTILRLSQPLVRRTQVHPCIHRIENRITYLKNKFIYSKESFSAIKIACRDWNGTSNSLVSIERHVPDSH